MEERQRREPSTTIFEQRKQFLKKEFYYLIFMN